MSERDDPILSVVVKWQTRDCPSEKPPPCEDDCACVIDAKFLLLDMRTLFAERPQLANELLPNGWEAAKSYDISSRPTTVHRSSATGQFVSEKKTKANPKETTTEKVTRGARHPASRKPE